jgi:hypothetical protein
MVYAIVPEGTSTIEVDKAADQLTMQLSDNQVGRSTIAANWPDVHPVPQIAPGARS